MKPVFTFACQFLAELEISNENIKYYASLVDYYTIYKLSRMSTGMVYVYLLCFVHNRYQRIKDNLLNCLISHVRKYSDQAKQFARDQVYTQKVEGNERRYLTISLLMKLKKERLVSAIPDGHITH